MKGILEFNLPEERDDFELYNKSVAMYLVLVDFTQWFRQELKYNEEQLTEAQINELERVRNKLYEILEDRDVNLDSLG